MCVCVCACVRGKEERREGEWVMEGEGEGEGDRRAVARREERARAQWRAVLMEHSPHSSLHSSSNCFGGFRVQGSGFQGFRV